MTFALLKTTGKVQHLVRGDWAGKSGSNGMEISQFTYFQQVGGLECKPVTGEITYGLERLAMYVQSVDSVYDLVWAETPQGTVTYRDIFHQNEVEQSTYNFEHADTKFLFDAFDQHEKAANTCWI